MAEKNSFDWGQVSDDNADDWLLVVVNRWTKNRNGNIATGVCCACRGERTSTVAVDEWMTRRKTDRDFPSNNNRKCVQFSNIIKAIKLILVHVLCYRDKVGLSIECLGGTTAFKCMCCYCYCCPGRGEWTGRDGLSVCLIDTNGAGGKLGSGHRRSGAEIKSCY